MSEPKDISKTSLSQATTIEEIGDFWDSHSLADFWDQTREVEFEVKAQRRRRVTLAPEVYARLGAKARESGVRPETLVNLWLAERLQEAAQTLHGAGSPVCRRTRLAFDAT